LHIGYLNVAPKILNSLHLVKTQVVVVITCSWMIIDMNTQFVQGLDVDISHGGSNPVGKLNLFRMLDRLVIDIDRSGSYFQIFTGQPYGAFDVVIHFVHGSGNDGLFGDPVEHSSTPQVIHAKRSAGCKDHTVAFRVIEDHIIVSLYT